MSVWLVRAGSRGEQEEGALSKNVVTISWEELPDLSKVKTKEELSELYIKPIRMRKKWKLPTMSDKFGDFYTKYKEEIWLYYL